MNGLNNYFGSQIALYFAWMVYYCHFLRVPGIFGAFLFAWQLLTGDVDNSWTPYFMIFMTIWSTIFLEYWNQRNSSLAYSWGVFDADEEERLLHLLQATSTTPPSSKKSISPFLCTIPLIGSLLVALVFVMIHFVHLMENLPNDNPILQYWPILTYSTIPVVAGYLFDQLVVLLNDFEDHPPV